MKLGETSFSDIFSGFVSKLPDIASGYAQYSLAKEQLGVQKAALQAQSQPLASSPYNYSWSPNASPVYPYPAPAPVNRTNWPLLLAVGGAGLLLVLALRK